MASPIETSKSQVCAVIIITEQKPFLLKNHGSSGRKIDNPIIIIDMITYGVNLYFFIAEPPNNSLCIQDAQSRGVYKVPVLLCFRVRFLNGIVLQECFPLHIL